MMNKCKTCIGIYEYKTAYPCRYCIHNEERHTYYRDKTVTDRDFYEEAICSSEGDSDSIPY